MRLRNLLTFSTRVENAVEKSCPKCFANAQFTPVPAAGKNNFLLAKNSPKPCCNKRQFRTTTLWISAQKSFSEAQEALVAGPIREAHLSRSVRERGDLSCGPLSGRDLAGLA